MSFVNMIQQMKVSFRNKKGVRKCAVIVMVSIFMISIFYNSIHVKAAGNNYYVSLSGSDSNDGSFEKPFASFDKAISVLNPGDTLYVRGGVYNHYVIDLYDKNGTSAQKFVIKNYPGESVEFNGMDDTDKNKQEFLIFNNCSYWQIDGLKIDHYVGAGIYIKTGSHNIDMTNLTINDIKNPNKDDTSGSEAIMGEGNTSYCKVQYCNIYNNGLKLGNEKNQKDHGIYIGYGANHWNIDSNRIHDNAAAGIQLHGEPTGGSYCDIQNNVLYNNDQWGLVVSDNAVQNNITNNEIYGSKDCDVYIFNSSVNNNFKSNVFGSNNANYNVAISDSESNNNTFDNNKYYKANGSVVYTSQGNIDFTSWKALSQEANGQFTSLSSESNISPASGKNYTAKRLWGSSRFDTAEIIAEEYNNEQVNNVIITSAYNYPDALSGSVLAKKLEAPILLAGSSPSDSGRTIDYIKAHLNKNGTVYVLGGAGAVSEDFVTTLQSLGYNINRIWGNDRYETNLKINNQLGNNAGTPIIIASGDNFPDALSISSIAGIKGYPIVLTSQDSLSTQAANQIQSIKPSSIYIVGGNGAISDLTESQIKAVSGLPTEKIVRIWGNSRYETSINIVKYFNLNTDKACFAYGENFPDALAGSILAAKYNAPIILVNNYMDVSLQKSYLDSSNIINQIYFGGAGVINDNIIDKLRN